MLWPLLVNILLLSPATLSQTPMCRSVFLHPQTLEARKLRLFSQVQDKEDILHLTPEQAAQYEFHFNSRGQLVYKINGTSPKNYNDKTFLAIWDISNGTLGKMFTLPESSRHKHSSFNGNSVVANAWMMKLVNGKIVELSIDSGHYRPTALNMHLTIRKLQEMGADLSQASVLFRDVYGMSIGKRLRMSLVDFMRLIEDIPSQKRVSFFERKNQDQLLSEIFERTQDPETKALISLVKINNWDGESALKPHFEFIGKYLNQESMTESDISFYLGSIYLTKRYHLKILDPNHYVLQIPSGYRLDTFTHSGEILLSKVSNPDQQQMILKWFSEHKEALLQ